MAQVVSNPTKGTTGSLLLRDGAAVRPISVTARTVVIAFFAFLRFLVRRCDVRCIRVQVPSLFFSSSFSSS